jgi:hypothetical protein
VTLSLKVKKFVKTTVTPTVTGMAEPWSEGDTPGKGLQGLHLAVFPKEFAKKWVTKTVTSQ